MSDTISVVQQINLFESDFRVFQG